METLYAHLASEGFLTWREVFRLVLLSGLFTALCINAFPNNAPSRRVLLLAAVVLLAVLPWMLASVEAVWFFETASLPSWTLASAVPNLLIWLWIGFAVVLIAVHMLSVKRALDQLSALPALDDADTNKTVAALAARLEMPAPVIKLGSHACATSLRQPLVVLPREHIDWDASTLRGVLAHELVHLKRHDDRWMLLTRLLVLCYWWMPWLTWLYRGYVRVMEESCDDAAAELAELDVRYVEALADAAGARRVSLEVPAMHEHHLVGRVGRFAHARALELDTGGVYWVVVGTLLVVTALTGVEPRLPEPSYAPSADGFDYQPIVDPAHLAEVAIPTVTQRTVVPAGTGANHRQRLHQPSYEPPVIYPGSALRAGLEGDVVVEFSVAHDGSVGGARIVESDPAGVFDAAALRAVENTRYTSRYRSTFPITTGASQALRNSERPPGETPRVRRHFRFRLSAQ